MASRAFSIPPQPMTGAPSFSTTRQTWRTTIGRMAGPESPPLVKPRTGRWVSMSMDMAG